MKTHIGSIQRKGRRYYLVVMHGGKQKWIALHTDAKATARLRASQIAPVSQESEMCWLKQLVRLGKSAHLELQRRQLSVHLSWNTLWRTFETTSLSSISQESRPSYQRWVDLLVDAVAELRINASTPVYLSHGDAIQVAALLGERYISANRMFVFYHRVWRTLSLDGDVWKDVRIPCSGSAAKQREYYRRLTVEEVRKVRSFLLAAKRQDYADMVAIGFYTGLRLSDVAELDVSEVSPDGAFLRLLPNKVRNSKPRLLTIPLIGIARACVWQRLCEISRKRTSASDGCKQIFLFPECARRRPSRPLSAAFRMCQVLKQGNGRASFHSLRATFISMMDEHGIPPHITDAITGHASGGMHARYTQPTPAALLDAVQRAMPEL